MDIYELFRRNLPFIVRSEETALEILGHEDNVIFEKRNDENQLIGVSVLRGNTIYLLCVDKEYRNRGIGTELLKKSEEIIRAAGYNEVIIGVGDDYLTPGVPTSKRYVPAENERLWNGLDATASDFFEHRGYVHSWDCNCFDMMFPLSEFEQVEHSIDDTIDGITYRWATIEDLPEISACTNEASEDFTRWYQDPSMYSGEGCSRVLVATCGDRVAGTLIVDIGIEREGVGSVGCTAVRPGFRGKHIAVNMVTLGTKYLKERGMKDAFLSYTYTGLDHLYGYAGYKICVYYMMARKKL